MPDSMTASFTLPSHITSSLVARSQSKRQALSPIKRRLNGLPHRSNESLSYTIASISQFGKILIASSSKGISAILLGGVTIDETGLEQDFKCRFPNYIIRRKSNAKVDDFQLHIICDYLNGKNDINSKQLEDLRVDLKGAPFQKRIWKALKEIPPGMTESYQQLTKRIGLSATSVRAIANACGSNHVAILVPCHRVIRSDGGMGGYHWGTDIEEMLLKVEREN